MGWLGHACRWLFALPESPALSPAQAEADKWLQEFRYAFQAGDLDHAAGALTQLGHLLHPRQSSQPLRRSVNPAIRR